MAFPSVAGTDTSFESTATTTHTVDLSGVGTISADDLIVSFVELGNDSHAPLSLDTGWSVIHLPVPDLQRPVLCFYRYCDGNEGTSFQFTTSNDIESAHATYRITGALGEPVFSVVNYVSSGQTNTPNTCDVGSSQDTLWFVVGYTEDGGNSITFPSGYTSNGVLVESGTGFNSAAVAASYRTNTAQTESPGALDFGSSTRSHAYTVGIRSDPTNPYIVARGYSYQTAATSHTVRMDDEIEADDLLLISFLTENTTPTTPTNWTQEATANNGGKVDHTILSKVADGTEGSTLSVSTGAASVRSVHHYTRWKGASGNVETSSATHSSGTIDPASITPSWGAADVTNILITSGWWMSAVADRPMSSGFHTIGHVPYDDAANDKGTLKFSYDFDASGNANNPGSWSENALNKEGVTFTIAVEPQTAITMVAAQGSYTLTGQTANLEQGYAVIADQGTITLTGQAASLLADRVVTAVQGSYTLSGQAATLTRNVPLTAAQGTYSLAGQAADLTSALVIVSDQGAYTITGQTASLEQGFAVAADQGSYSLTGQTANLEWGHEVAAAQGSYSLTGQVANLEYGRVVVAGQDSYTITGQAVVLTAGLALPAAQGDYTLRKPLPRAVTADATNDRITRGSDLAGVVDGYTGIISFWFRTTSIQRQEIYSRDNVSGALGGIALMGDGDPYVFFEDENANFFTRLDLLVTTGGFNDGAWHHVAVSWDLTTETTHAYVDGSTVTTDTTTAFQSGTPLDYTDTGHYVLSDGPTDPDFDGDIAELYVNLAEYVDLSVGSNREKFRTSDGRPVSLLDDGSGPTGSAPIMYFARASGEAASEFARNRGTGGDFTLTGTLVAADGPSTDDVNLEYGRLVDAAQGSYALTGQAANLEHGREVVAAQGSYTLTGQAATFSIDWAITADQGSLSLSGQDAGLHHGRFVDATQGSYAVTGQTANLEWGRSLPADQGSYVLTGQAAELTSALVVPADQGSYAITGQDANLERGHSLPAAQGSYSLTGQAASLEQGYAVLGDQGSYVVSGQAATFVYDRVVTAAQGSYTLSGQAATLAPEQYARPDSDVDASSWTTHTGATTGLYQQVDEATADDADYIKSPDLSSGSDTVKLGLGNLGAPDADTGHTLRYRFRKQDVFGTRQMNLTASLRQGATEIAANTHSDVGTGYVNGEFTLSEAEAANITDYTALEVWFTATAP